MVKLKGPEVNTILFDMEEEKAIEEQRISDALYARIEAEQGSKAGIEKIWNAEQKEDQINEAWKLPDYLAKVRGKVHKREADNKSSELLNEYKREPYENRKNEINDAWTQHEKEEKSAKAQADKLTAKQIKEFMQEQNN